MRAQRAQGRARGGKNNRAHRARRVGENGDASWRHLLRFAALCGGTQILDPVALGRR
jgi:hypothetical protein